VLVMLQLRLVHGKVRRMAIVFAFVEALPAEAQRLVLLLEFVGPLLQAAVRIARGLRHDCEWCKCRGRESNPHDPFGVFGF
jgi:hypothetical protein